MFALALGLVLATTPAKPADLVVTAAKTTTTELVAGGKVRIRDTVRNRGTTRARAFQVAYYLSVDGKFDSRDSLIGRRSVGGLRGRRGVAGSVQLKLPKAYGLFRVLVCADDGREVRESNEKNNCRATPEVTISG